MAEPHISLIGQITPEELLSQVCSVKANKLTVFNGYLNRFLFVLARRTQVLPSPTPLPTDKLKHVLDRIDTAVRFAAEVREIGMSPECVYYWDLVYKEISVSRTDNLVGKLTTRAEPQIMRMAMIYSLLDCKPVIDTPHLKAAVAVWEYAERSTHLIFKDAMGVSAVDDILKVLRDAGADGMTETEISAHFNRNIPALLLKQALELLLKNGLGTSTVEKKAKGAPATRWHATTKRPEDSAHQSRYLPLFESKPSVSQLREFTRQNKRDAKTRAATEVMLRKRPAEQAAAMKREWSHSKGWDKLPPINERGEVLARDAQGNSLGFYRPDIPGQPKLNTAARGTPGLRLH